MSDTETTLTEILEANERLLESIVAGDWEAYQSLCADTLTAFEPEARGELVEGLEFHEFYFRTGGTPGQYNITMCSPHVRLLDNVAVVSYIRLVQKLDDAGKPVTSRCEETRVWQREEGRWLHVHFHRSMNA